MEGWLAEQAESLKSLTEAGKGDRMRGGNLSVQSRRKKDVLGGSVVSDSLRPHGCSPLGSSVHGILQARIPEWVVISYPKRSFQPREQSHCYVSWFGRRILYH